MNARRPLACVAAVAALLGLSACEKPAPIVTVVNEGRSTYAEASTWCFEDQTGDECATRSEGATDLRVQRGPLGVDVDEELVDVGWVVTLTDEARPEAPLLPPEVQRGNHYYSFDIPDLPRGTTLRLRIQALTEGGEPDRGSWEFRLRPR